MGRQRIDTRMVCSVAHLSPSTLENTMATSSLLGIDNETTLASHNATGIDRLGPSDASDTGSDSAGAYSTEGDSDTDRYGTGERGGVQPSEDPVASDISPDHIETIDTLDTDEDDAAGHSSSIET